MEQFTDLVGKLIFGQKVRGYSYLSLVDVRELYRVWQEVDKGNKPDFINENVKKVLDKFNIETIEYGVGWKVA